MSLTNTGCLIPLLIGGGWLAVGLVLAIYGRMTVAWGRPIDVRGWPARALGIGMAVVGASLIYTDCF